MDSTVLENKYCETTNQERYLALDCWRRGIATERQKELAWFALLKTVESKAKKQYNQTVTDSNGDRALLLSRFLEENLDKPVRLLIYKYRQRFPTFELLLELYGLSQLLESDEPITKMINRNRYYYMRQIARLQREHKCWDAEQLTQLWINESDKLDRRKYAPSDYRVRTIRTMAEEVITTRWRERIYGESQLSPKDKRVAGL